MVDGEKKTRESTQEEIVEMLKEMVSKVRTDLETEKKDRGKNEDVLLSLLESTCSKLNKHGAETN